MSQNCQTQNIVMTAAKQTMAAWSKPIESREDIPTIYKSHFDSYFGNAEHFPLVILTPALDRFLRKTTEKLVCDTAEAVYIFEKNGDQIDVKCHPYRDIYDTELGMVLLDSWLIINGKTKDGTAYISTINFNTTSKRYFETILTKLRPLPQSIGKAQVSAERNKFNSLSETNFKLMNYGRESLIPGEKVISMLLQQEIRQPFLTLFGKTFYRNIATAHLAVTTDHELILIRDAGNGRDGRASHYGGIWQYVPLHSIRSVSLSDVENERLTLSIHSRSDKTLQILFDISNLSELKQFCSQLQLLIEGAPINS